MESQAVWKKGTLDGVYNRWYRNGKKMFEVYYKNGKKDGVYTQWYEDGKLQSKVTYKDDIPQ